MQITLDSKGFQTKTLEQHLNTLGVQSDLQTKTLERRLKALEQRLKILEQRLKTLGRPLKLPKSKGVFCHQGCVSLWIGLCMRTGPERPGHLPETSRAAPALGRPENVRVCGGYSQPKGALSAFSVKNAQDCVKITESRSSEFCGDLHKLYENCRNIVLGRSPAQFSCNCPAILVKFMRISAKL